MNSIIEQRERTDGTMTEFVDHPSKDFHYSVSREYNLKDKMEQLIGRNDDFTSELEGINLVIGIILSIALMLFVAL